jgi:hypothetical protein
MARFASVGFCSSSQLRKCSKIVSKTLPSIVSLRAKARCAGQVETEIEAHLESSVRTFLLHLIKRLSESADAQR